MAAASVHLSGAICVWSGNWDRCPVADTPGRAVRVLFDRPEWGLAGMRF